MAHLDEAHHLQGVNRLPDRGAADTEELRQLTLGGQAVAQTKAPGGDEALDLSHDDFGDGGGLADRRETESVHVIMWSDHNVYSTASPPGCQLGRRAPLL